MKTFLSKFIKQLKLPSIFALSIYSGLLSAHAQSINVPITPASFNADIVADGTAGATPAASVTGSADSASPPYVFVSTTFGFGTTICASGATALPASQTITSTNTTTNTGITYTLQSYGNGSATNNNVLRLVNNATGTMTFVTPTKAATLYIVALGGSGATPYTAVVNFSDGTTQTITNAPAAPDWCGGAATYRLTTQSYYRITTTATSCNGATCQYLYELPINIDPSNYNKFINSVTFTNTVTSGGTVFSIFAMGAKAPCVVPTAQATAFTSTSTLTQVTGSFTAAAGTPSGYLIVQYPHNAATTAPASGTTYTVGQTLGLGTVVGVVTTPTFTSTGLTPSTQYDYYIYSYNSGTTCGGPIYLTTTPLTGVATTSSCAGAMTGTVPIGPGLPNTLGGGFTSLTNALAYINANGLAGNTTLALQSGYVGTSANETFPITFPNNPCINASKTLTIQPATGVTGLTITNTSNAAPVIDFNGATNVTINGLNYGLTIANTSVATTANTSTIRFINDAKNIVVTNCNILGSALVPLSTNGGTIYFATGVTNGNDSITISNNKIGANSATTLPSKGIYAQGSTTNATIANSAINITGNEITDFFLTGGCAGVYALTGNTFWNISNNKIFQTAARTFTASGTMNGIYFSNSTYGAGIQINGNTIGYNSNGATGTLSLTGTVAGAFQGIYLNMNSADTNTCNINNNIINNIDLTSSSGTIYGIQNASSVSSNNININNNQIQNITTSTTGTIYGISWTSATLMNILGNTINNISRSGTGTTYGIYSGSSSTNENVNNNIVSNLISTSTGASSLYGIRQNTLTGAKSFKNNQVFGFSGAGGTSMYGIYIGYGLTIDISGNIVRDLISTGGTSGAIYGIYTGTSGTTFNVYKNKIYNLSMGSTGGVVYGIYNATSIINAYNNIVGDLASTAYTSTTSPYIGVSGIYISSGTSSLYNNTVNLGSSITSSGTNFSAVGIYASTTPTVLLQNNLVVNNAVPKGSGKAVAYQRSSTTLTTYAAASNNNAFYAGTPGANNVIFWDNTNSYQTLAAYQTAMATRDQVSVTTNPTFVSMTGSNAGYLHITAGTATPLESGGMNLSSLFNTDYDGDTRPGPVGSVNGGALSFDIGADEFDGIKQFTCIAPIPGNTISSATTALCLGSPTTLSVQNTTAGTGVSYQWQASADGTTYVDSVGATNPSFTFVPIGAGTYYRCKVKCLAGLDSAYSTPIQINFAYNILSTTNGFRCTPGTLNLTAAGSTGTTLNWYATSIGGTSLGTGTTFTTPSLTTTTNYYVAAAANSPGMVRVGSGTSSMSTTSYPNPLSAFYGGTKHQMLFLASELALQGLVAGNITSISFDVTAINAAGICNDFTIRIGNTTNTALTGFVAGTSTVYNSTYTPAATGLVTFTLTTPYNWNGTDNLVLETVHNAGNGGNGSGTTVAYTTTPFNSVYARSIDNITPAGVASYDATTSTAGVTTTSANRPNVVFGGMATCSSPRVQVTATVGAPLPFSISNDTTVCSTTTTALSVTSTAANYNNVTWTPITNLYTNAAGTIAYVANTNASTVYVRNTAGGVQQYIANANNTTTMCTASDTITVTSFPSTSSALATPGELCVTGTSTLSLSPATTIPGVAYQWQTSDNNIAFINVTGVGNAATYTTPTLTSTKYYRAVVSNGAVTCFTSVSDTVRVNDPQLLSSNGASRCGNGTLTLTATANANSTIVWYTAATGGTAVSTGASYTTPSLSATTNYWVAARSNFLSTCESPRVQIVATVLPRPTATISPTGTINLCSGQTQLLTAGGSTTDYVWLKNGVIDQPTNTSNTFTVSSTGSYRAIVGNSSGCKDTSTTTIVNINPRPNVNLGNDTTFCGNISYTLNAGNPGSTYLWNNNSTNSTLPVTSAGQYSVTVTNAFNCSSSDTINIAYNPYPVVHLGNDTMICRTIPLILDAQNVGSSYNWSTGANSQTISVDQAGSYSVEVINTLNCSAKDTINVTLMPLPTNLGFNFIPLFDIEPGKVKFMPIFTAPGYSYYWDFGDGQFDNVQNPEHVFVNNGSYTVSLTVNDGCADSTEVLEIYVDRFTSVRKVDGQDIKLNIYPNPTNNVLNIELLSADINIQQVKVFNVLGQIVETINAPRNTTKQQVNVGHLSSGNYIIKIETDKGNINRKFEVIK